LGLPVPDGPRIALGEVRQRGGKIVTVFAVKADVDVTDARSDTVELQWPRGSGRTLAFTEIDRVEWSSVDAARVRLLAGQVPILDRLLENIGQNPSLRHDTGSTLAPQ
jgi:predicted NUDIX family NTP pyrophosphohydrolase